MDRSYVIVDKIVVDNSSYLIKMMLYKLKLLLNII